MGCCRNLGQWLSPNTHCQGLHRAAGTSKGWQKLPWWPGVKLCVVTGRWMWTLAEWREEIWEPQRKATWICWRFTTSQGGEGNGFPLQYSRPETSMDRGAWRATNTHREGDVSCPSRHDTGSPRLLAALRSLAVYRVPSQQITWVLWWGKELIARSVPWRVEAHQRKKSFHKHTDLSLTWIIIKLICNYKLQKIFKGGNYLVKVWMIVVNGGVQQIRLGTGISSREPTVFHFLVMMDFQSHSYNTRIIIPSLTISQGCCEDHRRKTLFQL